jgi:hypothetical protein
VRALTIRQPWAGSFFAERNPKNVENRPFASQYRGPVMIHAGQRLASEPTAMSTVTRLLGGEPQIGAPRGGVQWALGQVIGVAELVSIHPVEECGGKCSPWALPARAHWCFAKARLLRRPVPAFGKLGLWTPDDELVAEVRRVGFSA